MYAIRSYYAADGGGAEQARRAPAQEDRRDRPAFGQIKIAAEVRQQGVDVSIFRQFGRRRVGIEIAVRTFPDAPWKMHVQGQRLRSYNFV